MTSLRKEEKQYGREIHPFGFCKVVRCQQTPEFFFGKQTVQSLKIDSAKISKISLLFDLNVQYRGI